MPPSGIASRDIMSQAGESDGSFFKRILGLLLNPRCSNETSVFNRSITTSFNSPFNGGLDRRSTFSDPLGFYRRSAF